MLYPDMAKFSLSMNKLPQLPEGFTNQEKLDVISKQDRD